MQYFWTQKIVEQRAWATHILIKPKRPSWLKEIRSVCIFVKSKNLLHGGKYKKQIQKQTIKISAPEREEKFGLLGATYLVSKCNSYCQHITPLDLHEIQIKVYDIGNRIAFTFVDH